MAQKRQTKRTRGSKRKTGGSFFGSLFGYNTEKTVEPPTPAPPTPGGGKRRTKKNKRRSSKK
jgi:hypothetical protein